MLGTGQDIESYLTELTTDLHAGMGIFARLDAPVIAAVNGSAAGAGLGLVLAADIAIAGRTAKFTAAYSGVALTPDAGCTFLLPRAVGRKRAMNMFLTNRVLSADQAFEWGLISEIVDDADLMEMAAKIAGQIADGPVGAFGAIKKLMAESQPGFEAHLRLESHSIASHGATSEGLEGITAFLEKRPPRYPLEFT